MSGLSAFIREHSEQILVEWEAFARAMPLPGPIDVTALRDHAQAMLDAIATDLDTPQTAHEQSQKARGLVDVDHQASSSAATDYGSGRAASGFTVIQMVAEFRALRASVIRSWTSHEKHLGPADIEDLIRFNEAIDQAVAESLARYSSEINEARERFLAILGHDLRNPLGAIATSAKFLLETDASPDEQAELVRGIDKASHRMSVLVNDMLDLALNQLGEAVPITRTPSNLAAIISDVVAEVSAFYPRARIESHSSGDLTGDWDAARLAQAFTNLLGNAVQHGDSAQPIRIDLRSESNAVVVAIHNAGQAIPPGKRDRIFDRMSPDTIQDSDGSHLGLGLFIVDKIVDAHGGTIEMHSDSTSGTTFTVRLPKTSASQA
jgi:signal transduction histidine kinase